MALQGDLLAAHVLGIQNLIVVHSEDMANGDHREAKPVYDLDEIDLLEAIETLQEGKDLAGFDLDGSPSFTTGCTLSPFTNETNWSGIQSAQKKSTPAPVCGDAPGFRSRTSFPNL